jgi:uncharacterized protein YecE (DUF72 family)
MTQKGRVGVGTSGWVYRHWRGVFYPPRLRVGDWFAFYARHFDTVEINNTFYRLPSESAVSAWKEQAPRGFLYAVKVSRFLTHRKKLKDAEESLDTFLGLARRLGNHLGPLLYQLPPRWHCDVPRLRQFIDLLPRDLTHVFEFRDPSWCNEEVRALLAETGMSFCIHDMPGFACPEWVTARTVYLRFHGPGAKRYAGRYDRARLRDGAGRIDGYREAGHDVFVYFNNDVGGHAVTNAIQLREELGEGVHPPEPGRARAKLSPA